MPYLSRHAHAGDKRAWAGPDLVRPLSGTGRCEAHGLLTQLRDYPISRILSSPTVRCLQTVEPLAARRRLTTETSEPSGWRATRRRWKRCWWTRGQGSCWCAAMGS
jgi:broad specificity phosphatase PhoE